MSFEANCISFPKKTFSIEIITWKNYLIEKLVSLFNITTDRLFSKGVI